MILEYLRLMSDVFCLIVSLVSLVCIFWVCALTWPSGDLFVTLLKHHRTWRRLKTEILREGTRRNSEEHSVKFSDGGSQLKEIQDAGVVPRTEPWTCWGKTQETINEKTACSATINGVSFLQIKTYCQDYFGELENFGENVKLMRNKERKAKRNCPEISPKTKVGLKWLKIKTVYQDLLGRS